MQAFFLIVLILLLFDNGKANVFKRIDSDCQPSGVHCLSSNTFTYCLNRGGVSALLYFEFNCPRNYICDDSAKSACVRRPIQSALLNNDIKTTTESILIDRILNGLITNSLQEQVYNIMGRVPSVEIEAEDVNVHNIGSNSVIITPTTTTITTPILSDKFPNRITPINFLTSASVMFADDSGEDPDSTIITSDGVNTGSGGSVIITPDSPSSSEEGSSVIITPSDPNSPGSVIITPDTTVSPGSVIITPEDDDSVIITPTTTTPGSIIIVPKIESAIGVSQSSSKDAPTAIITSSVHSNKPSNKITPINFLSSASVMFAEDSGEDPDSTIITSDGVNTGSGGSVIITPDSPSSSEEGSSVIITPSDPNPPGSVIITPDTTVSPGSVIITPEDDDSVIITPTTTTPGSIIIVPKIESAIGVSQSSSKDAPTAITTTSVHSNKPSNKITPINFLSSASAMFAEDSGEDPDSTIITSDGVNTGSGDSVIITPDSPSSSEEGSSVIITPSDPNPPGSVIITPDTTVSPGSVIITPEDDDSVIITPTTTAPGSIIIVPKIESAIGVSQSSSKDAPTAITTTSVQGNKPSNKIIPINFLTSASAMFVEDSGEDPDSTIITSDGVNIGSGDSVIITPDSPSSSEEGSSVIITPSDPSPPGSVIITPDTTVSPGSIVITPEDDDSVIITPTTTTPGSIIIVPKIESTIGVSQSSFKDAPTAITTTSVHSNKPSNKITPINFLSSASAMFAEDSGEDPDSTIITSDGVNTGSGGSVIITPDSPSSSEEGSSVIITPSDPNPPGSVIITPDTTVSPGSVIITPEDDDSVIITPTTTTPGSIIIVPKIEAASGASATKITSAVGNNLLNKISPINSASGSTVFAADSSEQADSTIITSNSSSNSDGSAIAKTQPSSGPVNISPGSDPVGPVIVEPKVGEEPLIKQSVIITPSTTATPPGVIITPSSSTTTSGSVIIVPTTTPPVTGDTPPDCTGVGYYWGPTCTQYYSCIAVWWWYEYRLETCSSGLWFSLANGACVNPADSECV